MRARQRAQTQAAKAAEKARKAYEQAQAADQKERARLYMEARIAEVSLQNEQLEQMIFRLGSLLKESLSVDTFIDLDTLKQIYKPSLFDPGPLGLAAPPPILQAYLPPVLSGIQKMLPGAKERYDRQVAQAYACYEADRVAYTEREAQRQQALAHAQAAFEQQVREEHQKIVEHNAEIEAFQRDLAAGVPSAIVNYYTMILDASAYPEDFPQHIKVAYVPESKQLVVEYDFPTFASIPAVGSYKYIKTKDSITETMRPMPQRKSLYASVIAQIILRSLYELFKLPLQATCKSNSAEESGSLSALLEGARQHHTHFSDAHCRHPESLSSPGFPVLAGLLSSHYALIEPQNRSLAVALAFPGIDRRALSASGRLL